MRISDQLLHAVQVRRASVTPLPLHNSFFFLRLSVLGYHSYYREIVHKAFLFLLFFVSFSLIMAGSWGGYFDCIYSMARFTYKRFWLLAQEEKRSNATQPRQRPRHKQLFFLRLGHGTHWVLEALATKRSRDDSPGLPHGRIAGICAVGGGWTLAVDENGALLPQGSARRREETERGREQPLKAAGNWLPGCLCPPGWASRSSHRLTCRPAPVTRDSERDYAATRQDQTEDVCLLRRSGQGFPGIPGCLHRSC
ncbi:hypothetical protein VTH06DRAFT_3652 [Thermothelomyces fergusii]